MSDRVQLGLKAALRLLAAVLVIPTLMQIDTVLAKASSFSFVG